MDCNFIILTHVDIDLVLNDWPGLVKNCFDVFPNLIHVISISY